MRLAALEPLVPGTTLIEKTAFLATLGVSGIELLGQHLLTQAPQMLRATQETGVRAAAVLLEPDSRLWSADEAGRRQGLGALRAHLAAAADAGAGTLVIPPPLPGDVPANPDAVELAHRYFTDSLMDVADLAWEHRVKLVVVHGNRREAAYVHRLDDAVTICRRVNHPAVGLAASLYHMSEEGEPLPVSIDKAQAYVQHIYLADTNQSPPGTGAFNFLGVFRVLQKIGFDQFMTIDCRFPQPSFEAFTDVIRFLRQQVAASWGG